VALNTSFCLDSAAILFLDRFLFPATTGPQVCMLMRKEGMAIKTLLRGRHLPVLLNAPAKTRSKPLIAIKLSAQNASNFLLVSRALLAVAGDQRFGMSFYQNISVRGAVHFCNLEFRELYWRVDGVGLV